MFGYVRPDKGELLVREFVRFRSVYCGICKTIGRNYGQVQRLALTYDITMLGVLLVSLAEIEFKEKMDRCILNPVTKKPMMIQNEILERCAALSIMLAYGKFQDEIRDEKPLKGRIGRKLFRIAYLKAMKLYPDDAALIDDGLQKLHRIEEGNISVKSYVNAAAAFGEILESLFRKSFLEYFPDESRKGLLLDGISRLGYNIGEWIFIIDAVDDYEHDKKKGNWNPFMDESRDDSKRIAQELMIGYETQIDQIAALLPYKRDAGIISNIFQNGMPLIRQKIFAEQKLGRL
ncbi:MAG: DUF5685 family protein [Saccharofermentanales bacterium]